MGRQMMMNVKSRLLVVLAALLLVPVFVLPLWSIRIIAPQYNDGLGMFIGLRDIWGHTEHDIQNINILNHYIGMRPIIPAEVDVLQIMPWVVLFLIGTGLLVALANRRWLVASWLVAFAVLGAAGMYEFYSWNYEYGNNLSPDAPIKVPGMTYVPPIIGTKTLLTIRASSYPSWGTLFMVLSFASAVAALVVGRRGAALAGTVERVRQRALSAAAVALLALVTTACGTAAGDSARPAPAEVPAFAPAGGTCDFCGGEIPAERFGGELVTRSGDTLRFMSVECLAGFVASGRVPGDEVRSIRVVDYNQGERLIDATTALYVRSEQRKSPNGLNLLATEKETVAHNLHFFFGGERLDWAGVLELVAREWTT
jgi:copper chaperone NosL